MRRLYEGCVRVSKHLCQIGLGQIYVRPTPFLEAISGQIECKEILDFRQPDFQQSPEGWLAFHLLMCDKVMESCQRVAVAFLVHGFPNQTTNSCQEMARNMLPYLQRLEH